MTKRLDGKVALVSGAARGMGEAIARRFVGDGARVVLGDVLDEPLAQVAKSLGGAAEAVGLDVTDESQWQTAVDLATERFGGLDIVVNNAGISGSPMPMVFTAVEDYRRVIEVNQVGVFLGMKVGGPALVARGGGSIINISSVDGLRGQAMVIPYVASKFAVRGMTKVAAIELGGSKVRVNSIHPGAIDTHMLSSDNFVGLDIHSMFDFTNLPGGRIGKPEDVANLALFLASDESSYCTGSEFVVDGGMTTSVNFPLAR